jgi:hypothetical protein
MFYIKMKNSLNEGHKKAETRPVVVDGKRQDVTFPARFFNMKALTMTKNYGDMLFHIEGMANINFSASNISECGTSTATPKVNPKNTTLKTLKDNAEHYVTTIPTAATVLPDAAPSTLLSKFSGGAGLTITKVNYTSNYRVQAHVGLAVTENTQAPIKIYDCDFKKNTGGWSTFG